MNSGRQNYENGSLERNVANQDMQSHSQDSLSLRNRFVMYQYQAHVLMFVLVTPLQKFLFDKRHSRRVNIIFLSLGTMT